MSGCWISGRKFKKLLGIVEVAKADLVVCPMSFYLYGRTEKTVLVVDLFEDFIERICEEIRPGIYAMWTDPTERFQR